MKQTAQHTIILLLLLLFGGVTASAQTNDVGLWTSVDVSKKLSKKLKLGFEEEYRLRNNLLTTDKFASTVELSYKVTNYLSTGASYVLINYFHPRDDEHEHNFWELRNRFNLFMEGTVEVGRFEISLRERVQSTYRILDSLSSASLNPKYHLRSKFDVSYNVKGMPLEPYALVEFFHLLNGDQSFIYEKYRIGVGLKYSISKKMAVKCGYLYATDTDPDEAVRGHNLTVGLGLKL